MPDPMLRIAIACAGGPFRRWQVECLRHLMAVRGVAIVGVIELPPMPGQGRLLYRRWLRHASRSGMLQLQEPPQELAGMARIAGLEGKGLEMLRKGGADVLLQLSGPELPFLAEALLPHGQWRFALGTGYMADPVPGLWERLQGEKTTAFSLQRVQGPTQLTVLEAGCHAHSGLSPVAVADRILSCWAEWPARVCRALLAGRELGQLAVPPGPRNLGLPGNWAMLHLMYLRMMQGNAGKQSPAGEWNIGVLPHPLRNLLGEDPDRHVRWLPAPAQGNSRSTPFGWFQQEHLNVLYMKSGRNRERPVIARLRPKQDNNLKRSRTVLDAPGPLSYPCIVEHEGGRYAVPEQCASGRVDLYRMHEETAALEPIGTLLDQPLHSPTLFLHGARWWLLGTSPAMPDARLLAFHADRLEGPYLPHALNPLKEDVRSARPGGTPFVVDGVLWRPSQDLGQGIPRIRINRVLSLAPGHFQEEAGEVLKPMRGPWGHGMRTVSQVNEVTLVDGLRLPQGKASGKPGRDQKRKIRLTP